MDDQPGDSGDLGDAGTDPRSLRRRRYRRNQDSTDSDGCWNSDGSSSQSGSGHSGAGCDAADCGDCGDCGGGCALLTTLTLANIGGLIAAVTGTGTLGHRLRHDLAAPPSPLAAALHRGVRFYQLRISALRPARCRYTPTCSAYAAEALHRHGTLRGTRLAIARIRRCRPGKPSGADPVP